MDFNSLNNQIPPLDEGAMAGARARWNALAKPLGSLGLLEEALIKIAGLTGDASCPLCPRTVVVCCADNGVTARHISSAAPQVTALLAGHLAAGRACVCRMAARAGAAVVGVDVGLFSPVPGLLDRRAASGTRDITRGPAMTVPQAVEALTAGFDLALRLKGEGCRLILTGELGIGNTTTSSALASVLLGCPPAQMTGRGAGLSDEGLARKIQVIEEAIARNRPDPSHPLETLAALGGFDIAAMAGLFLGGAVGRVPVLADGFISSVAALVALRLCPSAGRAMLASHCSAEPAAGAVLEALGLSPLITAGLRLGEGAGAVAALPLLDLAAELYQNMDTLEELSIGGYHPPKPC